MWKTLAVTAGLLMAASAAHAQDLVFGMWPSPEDCSPDKARPVDLREVLKAPRDYNDQCVTVEGYYVSAALFVDADDTVFKYPQQNPKLANGRLGVSGANDAMAALQPYAEGSYVQLTGKLWICEDYPDWTGGYCADSHGPFLGLSAFRAVREPLKNQED